MGCRTGASAPQAWAKKQLHRFVELSTEDSPLSSKTVHDLRVSLRRLRTYLRIAQDCGDEKARKNRQRVKGLAAELGTVRDCDVLSEHLARDVEAGELDFDEADGWLKAIALERENKDKVAAAALTCPYVPKWVSRMQRQLDAPWELDPKRLKRQHRKLIQTVVIGLQPECDEELHQLRIDVKRLRYFLELTQGESAESKELSKVQDALGDCRDLGIASIAAANRGLLSYSCDLKERASDLRALGLARLHRWIQESSAWDTLSKSAKERLPCPKTIAKGSEETTKPNSSKELTPELLAKG